MLVQARMDVLSAPGSFWEMAARLVGASFLGALVGFNRELQNKPAGLRTHALVCLGSALLALLGAVMARSALGVDPSAAARLVQGLLAGIGFIGGGVILHRGGAVEGLTTAASILVVAVIGSAVGLGLWRTALVTAGLGFTILSVGAIDRTVRRLGDKST